MSENPNLEVNIIMGKPPEPPPANRDWVTPALFLVMILVLGFGALWVVLSKKPPAGPLVDSTADRIRTLETNQKEIIKQVNAILWQLNPQTSGSLSQQMLRVDQQTIARLAKVEKAYGDLLRLMIAPRVDKPTTGGP